MREIKFRAWSNRDKCWCGAFSIHKGGLFTEMTGARMENGNCIAYADWVDLSKQDEIVLMQYTGLKDKNGKEIYEGDLLSAGEEYATQEVSFINGMFAVNSVPHNDDWISLSSYLMGGGDHEDRTFKMSKTGGTVDVEIIGNIYEHSELLT